MTPVGFPHSDIHGSRPAFGFPWLFVDRYVLLRLPVPRHPPCALFSLTCPSVSLKTGVFQSRSNHFWVLLAIYTPCSSMCISKILRLVCAQYTNASCLASHSSLFLYSVFKVLADSCPVVGSSGLEPPTSRLSGVRSNHLSYEPMSLCSLLPKRWWR